MAFFRSRSPGPGTGLGLVETLVIAGACVLGTYVALRVVGELPAAREEAAEEEEVAAATVAAALPAEDAVTLLRATPRLRVVESGRSSRVLLSGADRFVASLPALPLHVVATVEVDLAGVEIVAGDVFDDAPVRLWRTEQDVAAYGELPCGEVLGRVIWTVEGLSVDDAYDVTEVVAPDCSAPEVVAAPRTVNRTRPLWADKGPPPWATPTPTPTPTPTVTPTPTAPPTPAPTTPAPKPTPKPSTTPTPTPTKPPAPSPSPTPPASPSPSPSATPPASPTPTPTPTPSDPDAEG